MSHAGIRHMLARKKDVDGQSGRELILQQRSIYNIHSNTECHESRTVKNNRMVTEAAAYYISQQFVLNVTNQGPEITTLNLSY